MDKRLFVFMMMLLTRCILGALEGTRVGMSGYGKDMIGRTDWYLVILSSKTYVFEDKLSRCRSV